MELKRIVSVLAVLFLLTGCSREEDLLQRGIALRERLSREECAFQAAVEADFGEMTYSFLMDCQVDSQGTLTFTVLSPETISHITGVISAGKGTLTFDGTLLAFPLLADGEISPVSGPWLLMHTLRGGFIHAAAREEEGLRLTVYDSYEEDALCLDIWLNEENTPSFAEVLWQGRRILSIRVENFVFV